MTTAVKLMGFSAERVKEGESEFDAVFTSPEGRFLGEAEGRDHSPITVDKFSQLARNIEEDFAREGVESHAKAVLFGNAFRLAAPETRGDFFTTKCLSSAKRSGTALIRTPDLFTVARYLKESDNPDFARQCRETILNTAGEIVVFPTPPVTTTQIVELETSRTAAMNEDIAST